MITDKRKTFQFPFISMTINSFIYEKNVVPSRAIETQGNFLGLQMFNNTHLVLWCMLI